MLRNINRAKTLFHCFLRPFALWVEQLLILETKKTVMLYLLPDLDDKYSLQSTYLRLFSRFEMKLIYPEIASITKRMLDECQ
jgi:hypothetical protein